MARKTLDQFDTYEWSGLFWFPETSEKQFSGKVSYSPEKGISIEIVTTDMGFEKNDGNNLAKKVLHGAVQGQNVARISLIDVYLHPCTVNINLGTPSIKTFEGTASFLLLDHVEKEDLYLNYIEFQYEEQFENLFFYPLDKELQILAYEKNAAIALDTIEISMSINSYGTYLDSADELDTVFWSENEDKFQEFKNVFKQLIEDASFELFKRKELTPTFTIKKTNCSLQEIVKIEEKWRTFWELLNDRQLFPRNIWIPLSYSYDDGSRATSLTPVLRNYYKSIQKTENSRILHHLPISIASFGKTKNDLSVLNTALKKWFLIKDDPKWIPVIYGINDVLNNKEYGGTARYVALISEIETLLNHLDEKATSKDFLDVFVDTFATTQWTLELTTILNDLGNDSLGEFLKEIRNVITHPKAAHKNNGKYWKVAQDKLLLQKVYAYLSGLFIQVILQQFNSISSDAIAKYTSQFIETRASWKTIEFL